MKPKVTYVIDRVLHWTAAVALLLMLTDMGTRIHFVDYEIKGIVQHKQDAIEFHMTLGVILLVALIMRLLWSNFFLHQDYQLKVEGLKHKWVVKIVHGTMYLIIGLLMLTGILMVTNYQHPLTFYNVVNFAEADVERLTYINANDWHIWLESAIYTLIIIHFAGALYSRR